MTQISNKHVYIIAEAGINHNGNFKTALDMIKVAADCGANAIKFQVFNPQYLVTKNAPTAEYQKNNTEYTKQFEMLSRYYLDPAQFVELYNVTKEVGLDFIATPFDLASVDFLEELVDYYKVASSDLNNLPLLRRISEKKKPTILSTGMGTLGEVEQAVNVFRDTFPPVLLHCTSNYPCAPTNVNLKIMDTLKSAFGNIVGLSDHTQGIEIALAAVARGAKVIEKHFTLDQNLPGPDHKASLSIMELKALVHQIDRVTNAIGQSSLKQPTASELPIKQIARRSMVLNKNIKKGKVVRAEDIIMLRPEGGISPDKLEIIDGLILTCDKPKDSILYWSDFK